MKIMRYLTLACLIGLPLTGCDSSSQPANPTEVPQATAPAGDSADGDTAVDENATAMTVQEKSDQPPTQESGKQESQPNSGEETPAVAETGKSASSEATAKSDQLPTANLSKEASDMDVEPKYVDPRIHEPVFDPDQAWMKLAKDYPLWIDRQKKEVIVDGKIAQVSAPLEMFACPVDSGKEHESVVGLYCNSDLIHAALLAVGAKPGHPVIFQPEYKPPAGTEVPIEVLWKIDGEWKKADAKSFVRHMDTKEVLKMNWVFGGSEFYTDDKTGNRYYLANGGETVCVSNFSTAMLDLPIESSANAANQLFEANSDAIPPLGTPVRLVFRPQVKGDAPPVEAAKPAGEKPESVSDDQDKPAEDATTESDKTETDKTESSEAEGDGQ